MGKSSNVSIPRWHHLRLKGTLTRWDVYDVLTVLFQIPLQTLFYVSTFLLTIQMMWMNLRPIDRPDRRTAKKTQPIKQRNMTLKELSRHDGVDSPSVYTAVNGKVFDVSRARIGGAFAGKDASRALATFSLKTSQPSCMDDLSDLNPLQMDALLEWEMQYFEKYPCVGRLVSRHEPRSLQTMCVEQICAALNSSTHVQALPLPQPVKQLILQYGLNTIDSSYPASDLVANW